MLDERDLQAIAQIIDSKIQESEQRMTAKIEASEQRMGAKIEESASQTLKEAMQGAAALMESYFEPKFNLLFENQQTMLERSRRRAGSMSSRKRPLSCARRPPAQPGY